MFKKINNKRKLQKGFTIIEVMIVLAIAGLILVVVLLAIPQLQRNQRNEARRSASARIVTEIQNYSGNNSGVYPLPVDAPASAKNFGSPIAADTFFTRYLGCSGTTAVCTANIDDRTTAHPMGSGPLGTTDNVALGAEALGAVAGDLYYDTSKLCDGETTVGAGQRNFVFITRLEGGAAYCLDNK